LFKSPIDPPVKKRISHDRRRAAARRAANGIDNTTRQESVNTLPVASQARVFLILANHAPADTRILKP
jgi:hypothetical protein